MNEQVYILRLYMYMYISVNAGPTDIFYAPHGTLLFQTGVPTVCEGREDLGRGAEFYGSLLQP